MTKAYDEAMKAVKNMAPQDNDLNPESVTKMKSEITAGLEAAAFKVIAQINKEHIKVIDAPTQAMLRRAVGIYLENVAPERIVDGVDYCLHITGDLDQLSINLTPLSEDGLAFFKKYKMCHPKMQLAKIETIDTKTIIVALLLMLAAMPAQATVVESMRPDGQGNMVAIFGPNGYENDEGCFFGDGTNCYNPPVGTHKFVQGPNGAFADGKPVAPTKMQPRHVWHPNGKVQ